MICSTDFVTALVFLDVLKPITDLMLLFQSPDVPVWKLKLCRPKVRNKLWKAAPGYPDAFPRLKKVRGSQRPGNMFRDVQLLTRPS